MNILHLLGKIIIITCSFLTCLWAQAPWNNPPASPLPTGITHKTFHSDIAKTDVGYTIYLPPNYETDAAKRYPVVYMLGGLSTTENSTALSMGSILDGIIKQGQCCELIMVFPNPKADSWYCDSVARVTINELIPHIDVTYRTKACRNGRAIEGFSMGGYGAIKWAIEYPSLFCSAVSYSGKFSFKCPDSVHGNFKQIINDSSTAAIDSGLQIRMTAGTNEQELYDEYKEYKVYLEDAGFTGSNLECEVISGIGHSIADSYQRKGETGLDFHCKIIGSANCPTSKIISSDSKIKTHYSWGNLRVARDGLINLRLNANNKVSISLYNLKGRLMQLLLPEETKTKGSYKVQFTTKTITPGAYVICLVVAEKTYNFSLPIVK